MLDWIWRSATAFMQHKGRAPAHGTRRARAAVLGRLQSWCPVGQGSVLVVIFYFSTRMRASTAVTWSGPASSGLMSISLISGA